MKFRVVIADAGPLIALARIDALNLLAQLFGSVAITTTVLDEVRAGGSIRSDIASFECALASGWISILPEPMRVWKPTNPGVDAGEASAIGAGLLLRSKGNAVLLIIDDRAGRMEARAQGLAVVGTAGLIGLAKAAGWLPAARPLLDRLTREGYFIAPSVVAQVLADVGESDAPDA